MESGTDRVWLELILGHDLPGTHFSQVGRTAFLSFWIILSAMKTQSKKTWTWHAEEKLRQNSAKKKSQTKHKQTQTNLGKTQAKHI